jgi:hypothetical protein
MQFTINNIEFEFTASIITYVICVLGVLTYSGIIPGMKNAIFIFLLTTLTYTICLELKHCIKLGTTEYRDYTVGVVQGDIIAISATKRDWMNRLVIFLCALLFNFQIGFACFFFVEFFELENLYKTPTPTIVIPEKFPEDFCETDDVCPICTESPEILVLGCRHVMCGDCLNMLPSKNCPKCRHPIDMALVKQRPTSSNDLQRIKLCLEHIQ